MGRMVALILKATENCNSNCAYCTEYRGVHAGASLSLKTMGDIFGRIEEFLV